MNTEITNDYHQNPYHESEVGTGKKPKNRTTSPDFSVQEEVAQLVREKVTERLIYRKGTGAYGTFTVTHDISEFTSAVLFSKIGNSCKVFARFSGALSEKGSADTENDTTGFAVKFYTQTGNWDLIGNNSPVYYIKEPSKFSTLIKSQQRSPLTNLKNPSAMWDFYSYNPESLHQLLIQLSDRGLPKGYRHMHGYGAHTFSMYNSENKRVWVKYHFKTKQGIKNFTAQQALEMKATNSDFAQEDFVNALESGNFPKWTLFIQVMTEEQAKKFRWNPFDVTKVWLHAEFPLIEVGELALNQLPEDYLSHIEQSTFSPNNIIDGLGLSPDPVLQSRIFSYADAQRYRVGAHANLLEVNRCPFKVDPNFNISHSDFVNNVSGEEYSGDKDYTESAYSENEDDHFTQPGLFYAKALTDEGRAHLVNNIVFSMNKITGKQRNEIINRQLCHFFRANIELGMKVAMSLNINIDANMMNHINS